MIMDEIIQGEDVIGLPGQTLTSTELRALVGLADGHAPSAVAAALKTDTSNLRRLEASVKAKLGAKTHPHMIARGFILGVLAPRALCLLVAVIGAMETIDLDGIRQRMPKRSRIASQSRLIKKDDRHGDGPLFMRTVEEARHFAVQHCAMA